MPKHLTSDAAVHRQALREAAGALEAMQEQFVTIDTLFAREDEAAAVVALGELMPHLANLAGFCEAISLHLPELEHQLMAFATRLEAEFGSLLAAGDAQDCVRLMEALRYRLGPLLWQGHRGFLAAADERLWDAKLVVPPRQDQELTCDWLEPNRQALNPQFSPSLVQRLDDLPAVAAATLPHGHWCLANGRAMHSATDPLAEAEGRLQAWAREKSSPWQDTFVCLGETALYEVEVLITHLAENGMAIIVIDNVALFRQVLGSRDLRHLSEANIAFVSAGDDDELAHEFYHLIRRRPSLDIQVMPWRPWELACRERAHHLMQVLLEQGRVEQTNRCTLAAFSDEWQQHAVINLPRLARSPGVNVLRNAFKDTSIAIVAAGPSLNETLPALKAMQDRVLIMAVGTALRPLQAAGINPHIVVQVDSDPVTMNQYKGVITGDTYLMAADSIYPDIVNLFDDQLFAFSSTVDGYRQWLQLHDAFPGQLAIGGTVSLTAIDAAVLLGAETILTFGLDLAMQEDGTSHASGSMYDGRRLNPNGLVRVPGNWQETVPTLQQFANYIRILSHYMQELDQHHADLAIYNVNTAGARLDGMTPIRPADLAAILPTGKVAVGERLARLHREARRLDVPALIEAIEHTQQELQQARKLAQQAERHCRRMSRNNQRRQARERRLARCERQLKQLPQAMLLINDAVRAACMEATSGMARIQEQEQLLRQSADFYAQVAGAADWLDGLFQQALQRLKADQPAPRRS